MDKLRLRFAKTGRAVYISHLDLMRTMQRVFTRAGVPLRYSEGFNPHAQISIALPLSVGCASLCELMDFRLLEDTDLADLPVRLTAAMPEGIEALEAYEAVRKVKDLKWLRVTGCLEYDDRCAADLAPAISGFFARESIIITKKTKRGMGESDIVPAIRELLVQPEEEHIVRINAVISAQEPTLNPDLLPGALRQLAPELAPDFAEFTRSEVYDADMQVFR
jgi:radical SAM-linked protein